MADDSDAETVVLENAPTQIKVTKRLKRRPSSSSGDAPEASTSTIIPKRRHHDGSKAFTKRDINGRLKLQRMAYKGQYEEVKTLISLGADVNDRDYAGNTALHDAALKGHDDIVELLVSNGAIVDIRSGREDLDTPLINAAANSHLKTVKVLLDHKADPRIYNVQGQTSLDTLDDTHPDYNNIKQLLESRLQGLREKRDVRFSSPDLMDPENHPRGTFPSPKKPSNTTSSKRGGRIDILSMDLTSRAGREQVIIKASEGDLEFVGQSLENGWTPDTECLCAATRHGHTEVAGLLLAFGADVNGTNEEGDTPLIGCVGRGHPDTVKLLIEAGADLSVKTEEGKTCLDLTRSEKELRLLESAMKKKRRLVRRDETETSDEPQVKTEGKDRAKKSPVLAPPNDLQKEASNASHPRKKQRKMEGETVKAPKVESESARKSKENTPDKDQSKSRQSPAEKVRVKSAESDIDQKQELEKQRELAAKREKVRKERETAMLLQLEKEEQRKAEKRQREVELAAKALQDAEKEREALKAQELAQEHERRRLVQVAAKRDQPWGVRMANYETRTPEDARAYLPLLARKFKGGALNLAGRFVLDVQVALFLGVEKIYKAYPDLSKRLVTDQEKARLWTLLIPYLCPTVPTYEDAQSDLILRERNENRKLFMNMSVFWLKVEQVEEILRRDYPDLIGIYEQQGLVGIDLDYEAIQEPRASAEEKRQTQKNQAFLAAKSCNLPVKLRVKLLTKSAPTFW